MTTHLTYHKSEIRKTKNNAAYNKQEVKQISDKRELFVQEKTLVTS